MSKSTGLVLVAFLAAAATPTLADDPGQVLNELLNELTERQDEPLGAVLAQLRNECASGEEEDACLITALRTYLLAVPTAE